MSEARPFASLSSGLLARKGAAKPAMRPQAYAHLPQQHQIEDLGWNDMGHAAPSPHEVIEPVFEPVFEQAPEPLPEPLPEPAVVAQQRTIAHSFGGQGETPTPRPGRDKTEGAPVVALPQRAPLPLPAKAKTAFTLRLDPERHLKLRLATAVCGRSAQLIVTEALDRHLESIPEVDALAGHVPVASAKRS